MKVSRQLQSLLTRVLSESLSPQLMQKIVRRMIPSYDLQERTGYPTNIPITGLTAANQVTLDMAEEELFVKFVSVLIDVNENGYMGSKLKIRDLSSLISELNAIGITYNPENGRFMETGKDSTSKGWRILEEGKNYEFSFLRLDIVRNSELVRNYEREKVLEVYNDLKEMVRKHVEKRNGRIWGWEGDGVLVAFYFDEKNFNAVLTGLDILHNLFLYNLFECKLGEPLQVRIAINTGPCPFLQEVTKHKSDTLTRLEAIESESTLPDSITITAGVYQALGTKLARVFTPMTIAEGNNLYRFMIQWEE